MGDLSLNNHSVLDEDGNLDENSLEAAFKEQLKSFPSEILYSKCSEIIGCEDLAEFSTIDHANELNAQKICLIFIKMRTAGL